MGLETQQIHSQTFFRVSIAQIEILYNYRQVFLKLINQEIYQLMSCCIKIDSLFSRNLNKIYLHMAEQEHQIKFTYNVFDRNAKKVATLIKMANLNYQTDTMNDDQANPHKLITPYGQLSNQYEIIYYVINQSKELSSKINRQSNSGSPSRQGSQSEPPAEMRNRVIYSLQSQDKFIVAKMHQKLFELRCNLFPLLQKFYQYLTGKEKTRKSKYDSLMNKIKKEVGELDADINEHPQLYHGQTNFLNILISCELFMACKFVFEEKFRKSKHSLFNKYDKISKREEFVDIHGKSDLCQKQYIPTQFLEEEQVPADPGIQKDLPIPQQIIKMSSTIIPHSDPNRNQLLYTYFRNTFSTFNESKANYFPYFWLMFQDLNCSLVQILQLIGDENQEFSTHKLKNLHKKIMNELNTQIDYGMLGLYQSEKDKQFLVRGIICLGSKSFDEFQTGIHSGNDFQEFKLHKVNSSNEKQKKQVENLWEHSVENTVQENIKLVVILHV